MNNKSHLPLFGVGPYLIIPTVTITIILVNLSFNNVIPSYQISQINLILTIIGVILIILGIIIWLLAVLKSRISNEIKENNLVTTGIYGYIRHPLYSTFLYAMTGLILISGNILLFFLPVIYWSIFTVTMIKTEEVWLIDLYGDEYVEYSKKVNRFVPRLIK